MEEWKAIPGYEGIYEASNLGQIRSIERTIVDTFGRKHLWEQHVIKPKYTARRKHGKKDARVILSKNNVTKTFLVARIIAITWCEGYQEGLTVNHIDGNTLNNCASNLEWISNADNIRHGFKTGLYTTQKPCSLIDSEGIETNFKSISDACRSIGRPTSYIAKCLRNNRPIRSINGETYGIA